MTSLEGTTTAVGWLPLPPRKKKAVMRHSVLTTVENNNNILNNEGDRNLEASELKTKVARKVVAFYPQIMDNIETRRNLHLTHSTLESKDGCSGKFYEYLDHTADVQCHSWGKSILEAFENMAPCMLNYMTDIMLVNPDESIQLEVRGHDLHSLLYNFMSELLFRFSTDSFCTVAATIVHFDRSDFSITANLCGAKYDPNIHTSGTEIKAITYSNMQIHETEQQCDIYVIVDI